jgi:CDGSH-type Zn-finger protein
MADGEKRIRIIPNGPYEVTGGVKISERIITPEGKTYIWKEGRQLPQSDRYYLCRCGRSRNPPFCDGYHAKGVPFTGKEVAGHSAFAERAKVYKGPGMDLEDDNRCAFARFCHRRDGLVWDLVSGSDDPDVKDELVKGACECPAGRLVPRDKSGKEIEMDTEPEIIIIQDPQKNVSGGIFVKGGIELIGADGTVYETRNRYVLCRCGTSQNKPFCDAMHVTMEYRDKR